MYAIQLVSVRVLCMPKLVVACIFICVDSSVGDEVIEKSQMQESGLII
jgi:hypothetical protein